MLDLVYTRKEKVMIKKCTCVHEVQDKMYGSGMRVMNGLKSPDKVRCTACGTTHSVPVGKAKVNNDSK